MSDAWDDADQETGAVLDDVPLHWEDGISPVFPASVQDNGHLSGVRQRQHTREEDARQEENGKKVRATLRRQRYTAFLDRAVSFVEDHGLLPARWLERTTESGERFPHSVYVVRDNCRRWMCTLVSTLSFVSSMLVLMQYGLGAPSAVMHDGTHVVNMYTPSTIYTVDLSATNVASWIATQRAAMHTVCGHDLTTGYFTADIYHVSERRNITFDWLEGALQYACRYDAVNPAERCACVPAVEIGALTNAIFIDGTFMINPRITGKNDERFPVTYDDGTKASQPTLIKVEYMHRDGVIERRQETYHRAACIARSLELVGAI